MAQSIASSEDEDDPTIKFIVLDLQPQVTQHAQVNKKVDEPSRPSKIRNVRGRD